MAPAVGVCLRLSIACESWCKALKVKYFVLLVVAANSPREEIKKQYDGKLSQHLSGPVYEVLSRVLKSVAAKKIVVPGTFKRYYGHALVGATCMRWEKNTFNLICSVMVDCSF